MQQLYRAYVYDLPDREIVMDPYDYLSGDRCGELMVHAGIQNPFVGEVCSLIHNNPCIVAWVGHSAKPDERELTKRQYDIIWPDEGLTSEPLDSGFLTRTLVEDNAHLLNWSNMQRVDLKKYCSLLSDTDYISKWVIHPLPLLTAVGCGNFGEEYVGNNEDMVGTWAFERIELIYTTDPEKLEEFQDITDFALFEEA